MPARSCSDARRRRRTRSARRVDASAPSRRLAGALESALLPSFVGKIAQIPPMYSAVHHNGQRLYELAREGKEVERKAAPITIYGAHAARRRRPRTARLRIACSEGTYVRTLCDDLGRGDRRSVAHGRARARSLGAVRALRGADDRRDRRGRRVRARSRPSTSFRFRRSCSTCASRPTFAPDASCRCRKARRRARLRARRIAHARRRRRSARRAARAAQGLRVDAHASRTRTRSDRGRSSLAIGFFDGFHRGHREIARQTLRLRKPGWRSGVAQLRESSVGVFAARHGAAAALHDRRTARSSSRRAGFEECFVPAFDATRSPRSARGVSRVLVERLGVRGVVVGATFRFGHKRAGDVALMAALLHARRALRCGRARSRRRRAHLEHAHSRAGRRRATSPMPTGCSAARATKFAVRWRSAPDAGTLSAFRRRTCAFRRSCCRRTACTRPSRVTTAATMRRSSRSERTRSSAAANGRSKRGSATSTTTIYGRELALRELRYVREQRLFGEVGELVEQMQPRP